MNCTVDLPNHHESFLEYMRVPINDSTLVDISAHFDEACAFLDRMLRAGHGAVLVHCHAGRSRSASIVLAYLMRHHSMALAQARKHIEQKRWVSPNPGFWTLLRREEARLGVAGAEP